MLKKLFAITALATLAVFAVPAAASAVTYVPSDSQSTKVTHTVVPPDAGYVGSKHVDSKQVGSKAASLGSVKLASTGYDASVLAISGGSAALLLGLTLVTTSVVRRKRAEGPVRP
ncbi:hypothetical protein [Cryobacterium sp. PH31-L1]|uniref:hypothetical protein n=1 Tax=Cryobacterium sp. PH31-L1 TaxID=3046199 RepID=UPI0024BAB6F7|nr:hypothetical protein [Cryobacterium sp. PH31-L1]MDJ0377007.1 hypothetical protein [Cryobacterium sp. PH31-L1]